MSALQWIVKEAKSLKKSYPKRFTKWTDYVKQASAIYASKHGGKSPVGKKKTVKKVAVKKAAKKKVGVIKKTVLRSPLKKKAVKKELTAYDVLKFREKVGEKKFKALTPVQRVKGAAKKTTTHKDTKSHNVNIKVVSGFKKIGNIEEIEKGDILYSSWGYDQTNIDFFIVIKKTRLGVSLIPMGKKIVNYNENSMTGTVIPSEPNYNAKPITRKVNKYNDKISIKINTFSYAYKWNGIPKSFSNYA